MHIVKQVLHLFSCTLVHVYVFQRYTCSWYWEIYTSRCLSPIAKNLELSLYYSWYVFGFLAIKSSWIFLNLIFGELANPTLIDTDISQGRNGMDRALCDTILKFGMMLGLGKGFSKTTGYKLVEHPGGR